MRTYSEFLDAKTQDGTYEGFEPIELPDFLFGFQAHLVDWAMRKGKAAIFADTGLGKTAMQLVWADNVVRRTNGRVLILTPIAVGQQTEREGKKFDIPARVCRDGKLDDTGIHIANYERLHYFDPADFSGVVCDESAILKHFSGATQKSVTRFMTKAHYRLLCTATPAPNDYPELGTSSEALGNLGYSDMLGRFFVMDDKKRYRMNDVKLAREAKTGNHYARLAYRVSQQIGNYRMKPHAKEHFWRWVCSWARACRMPSDLGFPDDGFILPPLDEHYHTVKAIKPPDDMLFTLPAFGRKEELSERRRTVRERCEMVANLVNHDEPAVVWCHLNDEGDLLAKIIKDSIEVKGAMSEDDKIAAYESFLDGSTRVLIIKPKIGAWGMNWQHCAHVATFVSHSWEQYYQSIRRCYRFGQKRNVRVDIVASEGEDRVRENMIRKNNAAKVMFQELVAYMNHAMHQHSTMYDKPVEVPAWLS